MAAAPTNPVEVPRSWSQGYAVVIGTVGERDGRTKVYSPGYRADRYGITVDQVVMTGHRPRGAPDEGSAAVWNDEDMAGVDFRHQRPLSQPVAELRREGRARLAEGTGEPMMLILARPEPVEGRFDRRRARPAGLNLSGEEASQVAVWRMKRAPAPDVSQPARHSQR